VYAATVHWLGVVSAEISDGAEIYLIKYICWYFAPKNHIYWSRVLGMFAETYD
jgi:hypothetical protein